jgi:tetratricopeptide (TPR) repeat protein
VPVNALLDDIDTLNAYPFSARGDVGDGSKSNSRTIPAGNLTESGRSPMMNVTLNLVEKGSLHISESYIEIYRSRLARETEFPNLLFLLGNRFAEEKLFKHAERYFRDTVQTSPGFARAHHALGLTHQDWGRLDAAITAYGKAARADPKLAQPHLQWGLAIEEKSGPRGLREAIEHYEKAVKIDPSFVQAQYHLGFAWEKAGHGERALKAYRQALAADPEFAPAKERAAALEK